MVGPALVEQHERGEDRRDDRDHLRARSGRTRRWRSSGCWRTPGSETITRGYRPVKIVATNADRAERRSPRTPSRSRRARAATTARISAIAQRGRDAVGRMPRLLRSCATATVQTTMAMPSDRGGHGEPRAPRGRALAEVAGQCAASGNVAPWAAKMATTASPASDRVGAEQVEEVAGEDVRRS